MTFREARLELAQLGISLTKDGTEFRIVQANLSGVAREQATYFTDDLDDAVGTGKIMAQKQQEQ